MSILISGGKSILKHQFTSKISINEKAISLIIIFLLLRNFVDIFTFLPVYQSTFCSAGSGVGLPVGYGTANILTSSSAMLTEIGLRDFSIRRWRERCFITIQIWHERSYIFLYNISDSKARSMQESRINVQVSSKLAISQSQN